MVGEKGQGALYSYSDGSPLYLGNKEGDNKIKTPGRKISERTQFHTLFFFPKVEQRGQNQTNACVFFSVISTDGIKSISNLWTAIDTELNDFRYSLIISAVAILHRRHKGRVPVEDCTREDGGEKLVLEYQAQVLPLLTCVT